jgi:hypothetical protein
VGFNFISFSRRKKITVYTNPDEFSDEFLNEVNFKIENSAILEIKRGENEISFKGPLFRYIWNGWNLFNGISRGRINLINSTNSIIFYHKISFTEYLFIALFFTILPVLNTFRIDLCVSLLILIWIIFYLGSCGLTIIRFNSFINKTIEKVHRNQIKGI